jgi:hypothetical protein
MNANSLIIGGNIKSSNSLPNGNSTVSNNSQTLTAYQQFIQDGVTQMAGYVGSVIIIDKTSSNIIFTYTSPDNMYVSDVGIDLNGNITVAESSLISQSGRIITLDNNGNIINIYGNLYFNVINSAKPTNYGTVVVSI